MATETKTAGKRKTKTERRPNVFHQRLGTLTYHQAVNLLGDEGARLIRSGGQAFEIQSDRDVYLGGDLFRVRIEDAEIEGGFAIATITLSSDRKKQLQLNCDQCEVPCEHLGAALDFLLDAKSVLGLAMPPDESVPLENLTAKELRERAIAERTKRAEEERMRVRSMKTETPWTDYVVTSERSGRTYRVAVRGLGDRESYCTCPDFRTNRLGTCKHILHVQKKIKSRFSAAKLRQPYQRKKISLAVHYGSFEGETSSGLLFHLPAEVDESIMEIVGNGATKPMFAADEVMNRLNAIETAGHDVKIYPDAEAFLQRELMQKHIRRECDQIRSSISDHPLRTKLLNAELLPYQLDGIAFAAGAGRAILADDMGLGKTIQGIGVAELLAKLSDISRVLVVCPASLKSQWRDEIARFSGRSSQIVLGKGEERIEQYESDTFFTICNYEQVLRDLTAVENVSWDLIILDSATGEPVSVGVVGDAA